MIMLHSRQTRHRSRRPNLSVNVSIIPGFPVGGGDGDDNDDVPSSTAAAVAAVAAAAVATVAAAAAADEPRNNAVGSSSTAALTLSSSTSFPAQCSSARLPPSRRSLSLSALPPAQLQLHTERTSSTSSSSSESGGKSSAFPSSSSSSPSSLSPAEVAYRGQPRHISSCRSTSTRHTAATAAAAPAANSMVPGSRSSSQGTSTNPTARLSPRPPRSPHPRPPLSPAAAISPGLTRGATTTPVTTDVPAAAAMPKCQRHPASPTPALGRQPSSPTPTPGRQSTSPNPTPGWQSLSLDPPAGWQPSSPTPVRSPHAQLIQRRAAEAKERQAQMDEAWGALLAHDDHPDAAAAAAAAAAPPPVAAAHSASPGSGGSNEQRTVSPPASPSTSTTGGTATTPTSVIGGDQAVGEPAADPLTPKPGPGQGQQQTTLSQSSSPKWGASWKHLLGSGRRLKGWSSSGVVTMRDGDSNELAARHNSLGAAGSGARRNSIGSQDHARTGGSLPRGSVTSAGSSRRGMCRSLSLSDGLLAAAAANIAGVDAHEADASDEPSAEPLPVCPTPLKAHAASLGGPNPSPDGSESPDSPRVPLGPFDCPALQAPPESAADGPTMGMGADEALSGTRTGADEGVSGTTTGAGGIFTGKMTRSGSRTAHLADGMDSIADFRTRDSMAQGSPAFGSSPEFAIYSCPIPSLPSPEYAAAGSASQSAPLRGHSGNPRGGLCRRGTPRVVSSSSSCSDLQHLQSTAARASALQASPPAPPLTALHSAATLPPRSDSSPAMIGHPKDGRSLNGYPKRGPLLRMLSASCSDLQHLQAVALPAPPLAPAPRAPLRSPLTVALTVAATAPPTAPLASPPHTVAPAAALPPSSPQSPAHGPSNLPEFPQGRNTPLLGISSSCPDLERLTKACSELKEDQADQEDHDHAAPASFSESDARSTMPLPLANRAPSYSSSFPVAAAALPLASLPPRSLSSSMLCSAPTLSCSPPTLLSSLARKGERGSRPQHRRKVSFNSTVRVRTFFSMHDIETAHAAY